MAADALAWLPEKYRPVLAAGMRLDCDALVTGDRTHFGAGYGRSFGGVTVINPFDTFAFNVGVALCAPEVLQVEDWLTGSPGSPCPACMRPPRGRWSPLQVGRGELVIRVDRGPAVVGFVRAILDENPPASAFERRSVPTP